jgi:hypothetical protein
MNRGQLVILVVFGGSLVAAVSSIWYRYRETRPVLDFWGPEAVRLITHPDRIEALQIERLVAAPAETDNTDLLEVDGDVYRIVQARDVTGGRGLTNARHALTVQSSFQWHPDLPACAPNWQYALRLFEADRRATILFSIDCPLTRLAGGQRVAGIGPIAAGLETVLREQLQTADDAGTESQGQPTTTAKQKGEDDGRNRAPRGHPDGQ